MSKKICSVLIIAGAVLVLLGLFAPAPGIVGWEWYALIIGIVLLIVGIILRLTGGKDGDEKPAAAKVEPDDLTRIEGVGPKLQSILYELGYKTYASLVDIDSGKLKDTVKAAGFKAPVSPESWPQQAKLAADGKWDELDKLQDELSGGRM